MCLHTDWMERQWHLTPVLLPGKSHGWRSLVGYSPWGRWTQWFHFHFSLSCIGEGNGNPLQCSCLENPRDSRAWWAAIYGVTHSRTRLKWLSSRKAISASKVEIRRGFSLCMCLTLDPNHPSALFPWTCLINMIMLWEFIQNNICKWSVSATCQATFPIIYRHYLF